MSKRQNTIDRLIKDILATEDDNDQWHDGYQRTPRLLRAESQESADEVLKEVAEKVREGLGVERAGEVSIVNCETPAGNRRYDIERDHPIAILRAGGRPRPEHVPFSRVYDHREWTEPKIMFFGNADAIARIGRGGDDLEWNHSNTLRLLSDRTRVRTVFFGSDALLKMSFADSSTGARMWHYNLVDDVKI